MFSYDNNIICSFVQNKSIIMLLNTKTVLYDVQKALYLKQNNAGRWKNGRIAFFP